MDVRVIFEKLEIPMTVVLFASFMVVGISVPLVWGAFAFSLMGKELWFVEIVPKIVTYVTMPFMVLFIPAAIILAIGGFLNKNKKEGR